MDATCRRRLVTAGTPPPGGTTSAPLRGRGAGPRGLLLQGRLAGCRGKSPSDFLMRRSRRESPCRRFGSGLYAGAGAGANDAVRCLTFRVLTVVIHRSTYPIKVLSQAQNAARGLVNLGSVQNSVPSQFGSFAWPQASRTGPIRVRFLGYHGLPISGLRTQPLRRAATREVVFCCASGGCAMLRGPPRPAPARMIRHAPGARPDGWFRGPPRPAPGHGPHRLRVVRIVLTLLLPAVGFQESQHES